MIYSLFTKWCDVMRCALSLSLSLWFIYFTWSLAPSLFAVGVRSSPVASDRLMVWDDQWVGDRCDHDGMRVKSAHTHAHTHSRTHDWPRIGQWQLLCATSVLHHLLLSRLNFYSMSSLFYLVNKRLKPLLLLWLKTSAHILSCLGQIDIYHPDRDTPLFYFKMNLDL